MHCSVSYLTLFGLSFSFLHKPSIQLAVSERKLKVLCGPEFLNNTTWTSIGCRWWWRRHRPLVPGHPLSRVGNLSTLKTKYFIESKWRWAISPFINSAVVQPSLFIRLLKTRQTWILHEFNPLIRYMLVIKSNLQAGCSKDQTYPLYLASCCKQYYASQTVG